MDLICENYFKKETLLGIFEIIDKMRKHSIRDYKNEIDDYLTEEDNEQIKSETELEKIYSEQFHLMFEHIAEDFKIRLKKLKCELMKRLNIKPRIINKLNVIQEENESENKSENECDNESDNESNNEGIKKIPESKLGMIIGKYKYMGPYYKDTNTLWGRKTQEKRDTVEDKND